MVIMMVDLPEKELCFSLYHKGDFFVCMLRKGCMVEKELSAAQ